jgi:hypothetical protein
VDAGFRSKATGTFLSKTQMAAETPDRGKLPSGQGKLCLKTIAPHTLEVMRDLGTSTSEDIATMIINTLMRNNPNLSGQETIRRRIYDVINVLSAAGVIDKVGKQVVWRGTRRSIPAAVRPAAPADSIGERVRMKEQLLCDKVRLLTLYKVLIQRNFPRDPSPNPLALPLILIGVRDRSRTTFTQSLNRCELEIKSHQSLLFLAPSEILSKISLSKRNVQAILMMSPELLRYASELLKEDDGRTE